MKDVNFKGRFTTCNNIGRHLPPRSIFLLVALILLQLKVCSTQGIDRTESNVDCKIVTGTNDFAENVIASEDYDYSIEYDYVTNSEEFIDTYDDSSSKYDNYSESEECNESDYVYSAGCDYSAESKECDDNTCSPDSQNRRDLVSEKLEEMIKNKSTVNYQKVLLDYFMCDQVENPISKEVHPKGQNLPDQYESLYKNEYNDTPQFNVKEGDRIRVGYDSEGSTTVLASQLILEGKLVYTETLKTLRFSNVDKFLVYLTLHEHEVPVCELLNTSWIETVPAKNVKIEMEVDEKIVDNGSGRKNHTEEIVVRLAGEVYFGANVASDGGEPNVICQVVSAAEDTKCYALRDIKKGEQIHFSLPAFVSSQKETWSEMSYYRDFSLPELEHANPIVSLTGWIYDKSLSLYDISDLYGCQEVLNKERPIYDEETWIELRRHYHGYPEDFESPILHTRSFMVPYKVRRDKLKGRGIYATERIKKGELVYSSTPHAAKFRSRLEFLGFLATTRQDMVCDIMIWAFCQDFNDYGDGEREPDYTIVFMLDDGNFSNAADTFEDVNVGCFSISQYEGLKICQENYFALRDIEPGEEILLNYNDFSSSHLWSSQFGL